MKIVRLFLYQPYLLLSLYLISNFTYFALKHTIWDTISTISLFILNIVIIVIIFRFLLKNSLLRLLYRISMFENIPDEVLIGYLFIFTLFLPIPAIIIALFAKLFFWKTRKQISYTDAYGNEVTQIKSLTSTVILSRKEKQTGETEHIVISKLKKKPRKVIYE